MIPENQIELRQLLFEEIKNLREGKINPERLNAISHAANIAVKTVTQQINYQVQRGEKPFTKFIMPEIEFKAA